MASANVVEFTKSNWEEEVVKSPIPVLVDFWAVWCGPCKALSPIIDQLADQFKGKAKVGKLNTDDHPDIAIRYGISGIPQVLLFKGSDQPLERVPGVRTVDGYAKMLNRLLDASPGESKT